MLAGIAGLMRPGAGATALVSVVPRDGVTPAPPVLELSAAYARHGLGLRGLRSATAEEVRAASSSWAKRLRAGAARPVVRLEFERP